MLIPETKEEELKLTSIRSQLMVLKSTFTLEIVEEELCLLNIGASLDISVLSLCLKTTTLEVFYKDTNRDSPYLSSQLRLVVRGVDATFSISYLQGIDTCQPLTTAVAPFCGTYSEISRINFWGNLNTFPQKDDNAIEFYNNLTLRFSCNGELDHCDCAVLTPQCKRNLAIYACLTMFNPCDPRGLEVQASIQDCRNVESTCFKTFRCAGYPYLACDSELYFAPPPPIATAAPTNRTPSNNASRAPTKVNPVAPKANPQVPPNSPASPFSPNSPSNPNNPNNPANPNSPAAQGEGDLSAYPQWITGAVIALLVLVSVLFIAVIIGGIIMALGAGGAAGGPGEIDAYRAL